MVIVLTEYLKKKMGKRAFLLILFFLLMTSSSFGAEQSILDTQDLKVVYDPGLDRFGHQALALYPAIKQELEALRERLYEIDMKAMIKDPETIEAEEKLYRELGHLTAEDLKKVIGDRILEAKC